MSLLSVDDALGRVLSDVKPTSVEHVAIDRADGRVLARPLAACHTQPPFDASAMDGYAVRGADVAEKPVTLSVVGEAAAGRGLRRHVGPGEAARIFTGAPMPDGTDAVVIQENTNRDGDRVHVVDGDDEAGWVRPRGFDFSVGQELIPAGTLLGPRTLTLAAAMGHGDVPVHYRPRVAILATGDELVLPGTPLGPDQIVCSNPYGIAAMVRRAGGKAIPLGIARDEKSSIRTAIESAGPVDVVVTIGGASVGDHDLVGPVLADMGVTLDFWKIAMRPGKPLMFGRRESTHYLGLPGNPVSSLVCTRIFLVPLLRALSGLDQSAEPPMSAILGHDLPANGPRRHYMRATGAQDPNGKTVVTAVRSQDSSLLTPLATADVFIVRDENADAATAGEQVAVLPLDF